MVVREVDEVGSGEHGGELPLHERGVLGAEAEGDEGADVAEDGIADFGRELGEVLVREDEADAVLPELGEHGGEHRRRERVELVEVDEERAALLLGPVSPREGMEGDVGDEEGAEEGGGALPHPPLREVHEEHFPLVYDRSEVEAALLGREDPSETGVREERPDLVLERGRDDGSEAGAVAVELVLPEIPDSGVREPGNPTFAPIAIREQTGNVAERSAWGFEESEDHVSEKML